MSAFCEIEFVGDSVLLGFLKTVWRQRTFQDNQNNERYGISVSGQNIKKVLRKINRLKKSNNLPLKKKVVVMLGTNDIMDTKNKTPASIIKNMEHVVRGLAVNAEAVCVLTLPPIPESNAQPSTRLCIYNALLKKMGRKMGKVQVLDINKLFLDEQGAVKHHLFETHIGHGVKKRCDGVHRNRHGMMAVHHFLLEKGIY